MSELQKRECVVCKRSLDLTEDNFRPAGSGHLRRKCRMCERELRAQKSSTLEQKKQLRGHRSTPEYKAMQHQWDVEFNQRHPDYHKNRYAENKDEIKKRRREKYAANLEKSRAQERRKYERRKQRALAQNISVRRNKNKLAKSTHKQRRRSIKRGLPTKFTVLDWQRAIEYFNGCCAVCGRPLRDLLGSHTESMDHWIPLSSPDCPGTIPANIVPLCHGLGGCNNSKGAKVASVWLTERFGKRGAREVLRRIEAYFEWVKQFNKEDNNE